MLLDLTINNWKSYANETSFNLVASRERHFRDSLAQVDGFRTLKAIPLAAIYGGNASGKTGLFEALACIKSFVVYGVHVGEAIPVDPFRLDKRQSISSTTFDITFLTQKRSYRLEFIADAKRVHFERLSILRDAGNDWTLYERSVDNSIKLDSGFFGSEARANFVFEGTRDNQLFLTNAAMQNISELEDAYLWFRDSLELVGVSLGPASLGLYLARNDFLDFASPMLSKLDTGIYDVMGEDVDPGMINIPAFVWNDIQTRLKSESDSQAAMVTSLESPGDYTSDLFFVTFEQGQTRARRIKTRHRSADGRLVPFTLQMESSGSRRLINLMPMLFDLLGGFVGTNKVYVVDELDRCFHSMLTKEIIKEFVQTCDEASRRQLIFTTHDLLLMDQDLMRRDEMFIAERDSKGASHLTRLDEYEGLRSDKDLLRSYLDGRFGGVPMFS